MGYQLNRPDPAAMERLLTRHPYSPEGPFSGWPGSRG